jgi:exodeoxyribonuclease-3
MSEHADIKVLTWNIRSGGGKKCLEIIARILAHNPDVVVLTEFQTKNEKTLRSGLQQGGYRWVETSNPQDKENGLFVASKIEMIKSGIGTHEEDPQRWLSLYLPIQEVHLVAVHIPGSPDHKFINGVGISGKARKEIFWKKIIEFSKAHINDRVMIIGDFNTGFKEDAEGTPFILSKYMKELISLGYIDAWRSIHKSKKEYTWYSQHKVDGITVDKNGFRLDYIFVSPIISKNIIDAFHSHQERQEKVSDHSALACHFAL